MRFFSALHPVFSALAGALALRCGVPATRGAVAAVPTFHSVGLYWSDSGGSPGTACDVRYRVAGRTDWRAGYPLWCDTRAINGSRVKRPAKEYRGSLVQLTPDTTYEVQLALRGTNKTETVTVKTWSEDFPIARTVELPAESGDTLEITESGSPNGYILYTAAPGRTATIDARGDAQCNVRIKASYVIVRGLTLKRAARDAIRLEEGSHDVVIEGCDISGWGRLDVDAGDLGTGSDFWGRYGDAGVYSNATNLTRVIIQRNKIHHPRTDTNNWNEQRVRYHTYHPRGPVGIYLIDSAGHHVVRYNEIFSDGDHRYNDLIAGDNNFSYTGFPNCDSDIYGNRLSHAWDDAIEAEGGNCNVRIWGNYITQSFTGVATAATSVGPIYIFRNVFDATHRSEGDNDKDEHGPFAKLGDNAGFGGGRRYYFHNTLLQAPPPAGAKFTQGAGGALSGGGNERPMVEVVSRNNIWHLNRADRLPYFGNALSHDNDFDYDLHSGGIRVGGERNRIGPHMLKGTPLYYSGTPTNGETPTGQYALSAMSLGYDAGEVLPNFNDGFTGAAPDVGAHERGAPPMEFGVNANRPKPELTLTLDHANALYAVNATATFRVRLAFQGKPLTGEVEWTLTKDGVAPRREARATLINGAAEISGTLPEPGFLQCTAKVKTAAGPLTIVRAAAFSPEQIKPSLPAPKDFDSFWNEQKRRLAAVPMNPRLTPVASPRDGVAAFDLQADSVGKPVSGYYARPIGAKPRSHPAILTVHGAGVQSAYLDTAVNWAKEGALALDLNAHGIPNGRERAFYAALEAGELNEYRIAGRASRDTIYFRAMFIRLIRAMDFLVAQPEWDGRTLVVSGASQGGAQAIAAAGLETRVSFFVAGVPAMCDHTGAAVGRIAGWPKFIATGETPPAGVQDAVRYYDAVNFAARAHAPGFFTVGFIDTTCPPTSVYAAYNALHAPKEIFNDLAAEHTNTADALSKMRSAVLAHFAAKHAEPATMKTTHVFKRVGSLEIKADVYRRDDREARPVVVSIHGGALIGGGRDRISRQMRQLVADGVIVVSIDYRLAPETKLPAIVEDVEDAFKWVRERGPELFQADPKRIGVWGTSAGGYLTLTSGFRVTPRPQVLVSFFGYGDLIGPWYSAPSPHPGHHTQAPTEAEARAQVAGPAIANNADRKGDGGLFYQYCRQHGLWPREVAGWDPVRDAEKFFPYMAVKNITRDYPPTFLAHGTNDTDVPHEQSVLVAQELKKHGVPHEFISLPDTEHSFADADPAQVEAVYEAALAFTKKHLGVR